ncbi:MAG TPA: PEP/pyruvate-binding domain-containing protein [Pseudonocardiaceae bacterium]
MSYVTRFELVGRDDVDVAGGKGANLGELTRAGLPVPPGFVLTTAAYREFVRTAGIGEKIVTLAGGGPDAYDEPSARIRELFTAAPVPGDMAAEITGAWQELGGGAVAVRSSATAEDLEGASFAGQQDTYLNVRGAQALLAAPSPCSTRPTSWRVFKYHQPGSERL